MKRWQIWVEGYLVTGMEGIPALGHKVATVEAPTFGDACRKHYGHNQYYDERRNTYWGCRLHDNPVDAGRSFGVTRGEDDGS